MTSKEIFQKAVKLQKTPRVPVIILSGGVWAFNQTGKSLQDSFDMPPEEAADYIIEANKKVRSDLVWCAAGCNNLVLRAIGAKTEFGIPGKAAEVVEPLITSAAEVDKLDIDHLQDDPGIAAMLECTRILKKKIGDTTMLGISQWGPLTLTSLLLGTRKFMRCMVKDREAVKYIMEFTEELVYRYWKLFLDAGAEHVSQAEPMASGDMISPKMFELIALPAMKKTNTMIGDQPFSKMIHICGNSMPTMALLPETGADMISMDWKVDFEQVRETLDGKMAFAGKMDPSEIMLQGDVETVRKDCLDCIEKADWKKGGFILMPGCDLPPRVPLENLETMVDVAHSNTQSIE